MRKELFNQRDDLIGAFVDALFGYRVGPKDGAVDFDFGNEGQGARSDKFDKLGRSIPGIEDNG